LIPRESKTPEEEWRSQERQAGPCGKSRNGLEARKQPRPGVAPPSESGVEPKSRTGGEAVWKVAKQQARNVDLGMEAFERRQPLQASERPLRATSPG
jgi:hypothetical protein